MITINSLGKDGASILPDLDGSAVGRMFISTEWRTKYQLAPGDVIRDSGGQGGQWSVVADIRHNGILGISTVGLITADRTGHVLILAGSGGAEVRLDTRIDPDTLWQIAPEPTAAERKADYLESAALVERTREPAAS